MKKILLFLILLLSIPAVFADIAIQTDQHTYNLGNKIKASASVLQDRNFDGLFKLTASCGDYKLQYFLTPISLEAGFRTSVNVPELIATASMPGNCTITGDLLTNDNLIVEEKDSDSFSVTRQLNVLPVNSRIAALPGETIHLVGVVNEANGNNILKAPTKIAFDNNSYAIEAVYGKFNLTIELAKNIKSGGHTIDIASSDSKTNFGSSSIELEITAIPSRLKLDLGSNQLPPGSKVDIASSLYDQADDPINASLELELTSPGKSRVFRKIVQSDEKLSYEFSQYAEPGLYALESTYKNLFAQSSINITTTREVKVKYENETVFVENTGNVPFEDELTFILESEQKKYPILKKIRVDPSKILDIDLSKEVPLGNYNILVPVKEGLKTFEELQLNQTLQELKSRQGELIGSLPDYKNLLAGNVTIHDNRPVYKRIASGISSITGTLVGADGVLAKNPLIAPAILAAILLAVVFRYGRKPIMRLIRRKKDEDKEEEHQKF